MSRFKPGDRLLNKYRIERLIGQGGFAEVYLAVHLYLKALRALKVLVRGGKVTTGMLSRVAQRFRLEAELGARFANEPHIVRVYDFEWDFEQGLLVLVMEYLSGGSLKKYIQQARSQGLPGLPVDFVLRTAYESALGLAALHRAGFVHRDIKPSNILYHTDGTAKIADLGIVQVPHGLTQRTELADRAPRHPGTPLYTSPEQAMSTGYLLPASDIYSLGATLFEALTLQPYKQLRPGTRVRDLRPDVPLWLDELIHQMLAEVPEGRPWDGEELAHRLELYVFDEHASNSRTLSPRIERVETQPRSAGPSLRALVPWVGLGVLVLLGLFVLLFQKSPLSFAQQNTTLPPSVTALSSTIPAFTPTNYPVVPTTITTRSVSDEVLGTRSVTFLFPTATATPHEHLYCEDAPPSILAVGMKAYVCTQRDHIRLRVAPGKQARASFLIPPSTQVEIIDGPACSDAWVWWRVYILDGRYEGQIGWMAEGGDSIDPKYLCPVITDN